MECPKCARSLSRKQIGSVEVDECSNCRGVWFDAGELRQAKDETEPDANWLDFEIWKHADRFRVAAAPASCVRCGDKKMVALGYRDSPVEIDYCPECRGVWLNHGEFRKIVDALNEEINSKPFADYVRSAVEEARELIRGPESFASEWKDFSTVLNLMVLRLFIDNPRLHQATIEIQRSTPFR